MKTLKFVGGDAFMERLHAVGITSLASHPEFYGDGLALGNGEVSLYEMAQAYTVLAREGRYQPLTLLANDPAPRPETRIFTPAVATLIGNILADPEARMLEFGRGLQFPVETAIKTGTSTDYRDGFGNICTRIVAPAGALTISSGVGRAEQQVPVDVALRRRQAVNAIAVSSSRIS